MADSDQIPGQGGTTRQKYPWWVELGKWGLSSFLFPVAVCTFLLYHQHTVGTEVVKTLNALTNAINELRVEFKKLNP